MTSTEDLTFDLEGSAILTDGVASDSCSSPKTKPKTAYLWKIYNLN